MRTFPDPIFTPVAENIKANREDERKSIFDKFSHHLDSIAHKARKEQMTSDEIIQLIHDESEHYSNLAAELDHV
ncbi:DUF2732 family protein [Providencia huaxiensis]|uniref:DUF2732 family protein n=1 Tax=Providencia huaxiensis TaxID=2027290 RepID=UPI0034E4D908